MIQAKPTSQNARKSNPNRIFTLKKPPKSESIKNPTKLTRNRGKELDFTVFLFFFFLVNSHKGL